MNDIPEYKLNIHVEPLDGLHMSDYNFACQIYCLPKKFVEVKKGDIEFIKVDEDNYLLLLTDRIIRTIGKGRIMIKFIAEIPDSDFPDKHRTEVVELETDIEIKWKFV